MGVLTPHSLLGVLRWGAGQLLEALPSSVWFWTRRPYLGNHGLDPLDESPAEPAEGQRDGELLFREVLRKDVVRGVKAGRCLPSPACLCASLPPSSSSAWWFLSLPSSAPLGAHESQWPL